KFSAADCFDDGAIAVFQLIVPVWDAPALLHVDKVEGYGVDSARGERCGKADHEAAGLVRASAMREDQDDALAARRRAIRKCRRVFRRRYVYADLFGLRHIDARHLETSKSFPY